jgi:hypothetical protein
MRNTLVEMRARVATILRLGIENLGLNPRASRIVLYLYGISRIANVCRLFTVEGVAASRGDSARRCPGRRRGLPRMEVLTLSIRKTSTCTTLPRRPASAALI